MSNPQIVIEPGKQEIVVVTTYNAPRELVFRAYTEPELVTQWWGPRYLTTEIDTFEPRSGGQWRIVQTDPDGNVYAFHGVFHDISAPERIVQTFEFEGMPGHAVLETAVFEDIGGRTRVTTQSLFQSVADRDGMAASGMEVGINEGFEQMTELLASLQVA